MASLPRIDLPVRYNFVSAVVGQIDCQRIGHGALLRLGEAAASGGATPDQTVRGFLKRVGRKPSPDEPRGALLSDDDVAAINEAELEEFAEKTLAENRYLYLERTGREEGSEGERPRTTYGDAYLERQDGESAIDFLARAVATQPERQAADAFKMLGSAGRGLVTSDFIRNMFPMASRLAREAKDTQRALADAVRAAGGVGVSRPDAVFAGPSVEARSLAEQVPVPPAPPRPSDTTLQKLEERVTEFGRDLDEDEQVALISISAPNGVSFFVSERIAINREMISLKGFDTHGTVIEVVQHYTQFNVALMAVPKTPEPREYGFTSGRSGA